MILCLVPLDAGPPYTNIWHGYGLTTISSFTNPKFAPSQGLAHEAMYQRTTPRSNPETPHPARGLAPPRPHLVGPHAPVDTAPEPFPPPPPGQARPFMDDDYRDRHALEAPGTPNRADATLKTHQSGSRRTERD